MTGHDDGVVEKKTADLRVWVGWGGVWRRLGAEGQWPEDDFPS